MKSIRGKLILSTFLSIAACIAVAMVFSWKYTEKIVREDFAKSTSREVEKIDDSIALFFEEMSKDLDMIAENPTVKLVDGTVKTYIDMESESEVSSPASREGIESQIYSVYDVFAKNRENISDVFLGTEQGGYIQYAEGSISKGYDPRERPWYTQAMENPGEVVRTSAYYWEAADAVNVSLAKTVENAGGAVVGVQAMDISLGSLTDMIKDIKIGSEGYLIMVENDGTILSNPKNPETNFKNIDELDIEGMGTSEFEFTQDGEDFLGLSYDSDKTGWKFISVIPKGELSGKVKAFSVIVILLGAVSILVALLTITVVASRITRPIKEITEFIGRVEDGDFTEKVEVKGKDEVSRLGSGINNMIEKIRNLIEESKSVSENVSKSAESIGFMSNQLDNTADEMVEAISQVANNLGDQGRQTEHIVNAIDGFTEDIETMSRNMTEKAHTISEMSKKGLEIVDSLDNTTEETRVSSRRLADTTESLSKKSISIGEIVGLIDKVTEQTSLLSLNASIEAARAGEAGRGFAVVASEISKLAEESKSSTAEIEKIISEIQREINSSVESIERSNSLVENSVGIVSETKDIFGEMFDTMSEMEAEVARISQVVKDMTVEKEEIARSLEMSAQAAEQTAALSEEVTASTEEQSASIHTMTQYVDKLELLSRELLESINKFKV